MDRPFPNEPLVSVLIPAHKPAHFGACLRSALDQTYGHLEVVVSDDSPGGEVEDIVGRLAGADARVRYLHNETPFGYPGNFVHLFSLAGGAYVKFLNDDDLLHPTCVERLVHGLRQRPDATLVTSHRQPIDAEGNPLPDNSHTERPVAGDSILDGVSVVNMMLTTGLNFVGEPTTALFRKRDLADVRPHILSVGGNPYTWNIDVAMWVNLLSKGDLVYLVDTLSYSRLHPQQMQNQPGAGPGGVEAWVQMRVDATRLGFLGSQRRQLSAAPLAPQ